MACPFQAVWRTVWHTRAPLPGGARVQPHTASCAGAPWRGQGCRDQHQGDAAQHGAGPTILPGLGTCESGGKQYPWSVHHRNIP